jgi:hypothetical protein
MLDGDASESRRDSPLLSSLLTGMNARDTEVLGPSRNQIALIVLAFLKDFSCSLLSQCEPFEPSTSGFMLILIFVRINELPARRFRGQAGVGMACDLAQQPQSSSISSPNWCFLAGSKALFTNSTVSTQEMQHHLTFRKMDAVTFCLTATRDAEQRYRSG